MADDPPADSRPAVWKGRIGAALVAIAFAAVPLLVMCTLRQFRFSVPLGVVCCLASSLGLLAAFGTFDGGAEAVAAKSTLSELGAPLFALLASIVVHVGVLT